MNNIELRNVSYFYEEGGKEVLKDISLTLHKGEFVSILGHNGSGKSTLAKLLNGLFVPTSGEVVVCSMSTSDENNLWAIRSKVGMVFQNPDNQLIATIVEDDIAFGPENLGVEPSEIRTRIDEALDTVEMTKYLKKPPHQLSGGQKQRIAIAGVIAMKPEIIVFDEPTSMLDPIGRREVLDTIKKLRASGITVILITHYMDEALLSDRIVVMRDGDIAMDAPPKLVFKDVNKLRALSLKLPQIYEISEILRTKGIDISEQINDYNDLVDEILTYSASSNIKAGIVDKVEGYTPRKTAKVIELKLVNYYYNKNTIYEHHALRDISFTINEGEFIGVIGHTGSGKSSLVQLLNGLNKLDSGSISVYDFSTDNQKPNYLALRKNVGLVFQYPEYQLFEETVAMDVAYGPSNLGVSGSSLDEVVDDALLSVGLKPELYRNLSPFELSGGEKRRVAIAGVMAMNPKILILDEPAAGLDPISRDEVMAFIKKEHMKEGRTTFIVSHDMAEISKFCDRVLVLSDGRIVDFDTPSNVYRNRDKLLELGLDLPIISLITARLRESGLDVCGDIFDVGKWTTELVKMLKG